MLTRILQEQHTYGHLWWKRTYYIYYRYVEGSLMSVPKYPKTTIDAIEKGK